MSRTILALAAFAAASVSAANAEEKRYQISGFTSVSASAGTDVSVVVGGDYSVVATGDAKALERLRVELDGKELSIGRKPQTGWNFKRTGPVEIKVTMPALDGADVSSGASLDVTGVDAGALAVEASSGGSLEIDGTCDALTLDVSSGGSIDGDELKCGTANADASSGGSADLYASESLMADASSGGSLSVSGSPKQVSKDTSSGGSVSVK
jgi:hypothetical protein